jgi:dihydroneopterin aldolase
MGDRILLEGLSFYAYHGVRSEEKTLGQKFVVDLALELDLAPAGRSDDLSLTLDYSEVYRLVRDQVESASRDTIEAVAEQIATALLQSDERLEAVQVRLKKPEAPIAGAHLAWVAVEIVRRRAVAADG